jgi:hypothetical protein
MEKHEVATIQSATVTPMALIERALQSDTSIEKLEQLFNLQLKWEENEAKKAYHQAVADFKAESITILKDKKVGYVNKDGSFTGYSHATLGNIVQTVVPIMSKHGLSHSWDIKQIDKDIFVTCKMTHCMGYSTDVSMSAEKDDSGKKNSIQQVSSTVSYLERYTFLAVIGMAAQDQDDDGRGSGKKEDVEVISETQAGDLLALIAETNTDAAKFCTYYKISNVSDLPVAKYKQAVDGLEKKRGK